MTVLLCGVRADFAKGCSPTFAFFDWLPRDRVFLEEEREYSATRGGRRYGYTLTNNECRHCAEKACTVTEDRARYYLV